MGNFRAKWCWKNTLLEILATSLLPDEGTATILWFDLLKDATRIGRIIASFFMITRPNASLTVRQNLEYTGLKGYGFSGLLRDRRILLLFTAFLLVFSGQTAFTPFFNILAVDYIGLGFSQLGLITSLGAAAALMTRIASGWLSDKLTPRVELMLAGGLRMASYLLAAYAYDFPLLLTYLANRLLIFAPARNTMIVRIVPLELRGRAFALMGLAADLGRVLGATAAGLLAELYGIQYPFYFMALAGLIFTALISLLRENY